MVVGAWLERAAAVRPGALALQAGGDALTYADLHARAAGAARRLKAAGVAPGDRVALALATGPEWVIALHACLLLGAVAVPVDPRLAAEERARVAAGSTLVVGAPLSGVPGDPVPGRLHDLDAPCLVVHTSGTTSAPRPVELTYANWMANALGSAAALGLDPGERWLCALPLSHVGGLGILLRSAIFATSVLLHETFDAERMAKTIAEEGVTLVSVVPTMLARLLDAGLRRPPDLRCALVGGGPVPPVLLERAREAGIPVAQTYGMTEACSMVAVSAVGEPASAGVALASVRLAVSDDGEILVAGPTVAPSAPGADGWLHTGDEGRLDDFGRLTVTGRRSETIISGGENVAPAEVEAVLGEHPAVADAGVFGRDDPEWGETVVAAVVLRPGARAAPEELAAFARARLAGFKAPKAVELVDALPRTASGKLLRRALR